MLKPDSKTHKNCAEEGLSQFCKQILWTKELFKTC